MTFSHFWQNPCFELVQLLSNSYSNKVELKKSENFNCEQSDQDTPDKEGTPFDLFHNTGEQQKAYI